MCRRVSNRADDRGQILILTAVSMLVVLGIGALSIDASYMYDKRNRLHAAADAAAKSGAIEVKRNGGVSQSALEAFADQQVGRHGFTSTRLGGTANIVVHHPPVVSTTYYGNAGFVEVIASEQTPTMLGTLLGLLHMTPGARAVAGSGPGPDCIVTLAPPAHTPHSFHIGSSSEISMPGCGVAIAGDLEIQSSAYINALSTGIVGDCIEGGGGSGCSHVNNMSTDSLPPVDPLASMTAPTQPPGCAPSPLIPGSGTPSTLTPGCYSKIDATATGTNITLQSGLYYFTGPFVLGNNASVAGSNVTLYFAGTAGVGTCSLTSTVGCMAVGNNATMTLSAPTTGAYDSILFWQAPTNQTTVSFTGNNPTYSFTGALYFPNNHVDFRNGLSGTNDCTLLVAYSLDIDHGLGTFSNRCSAYSGSPFLTVSMAE